MPDDPEFPAHRLSEAAPALDSTLELVERVRRGDKEALDRLLARHVKPLRRWVSGRLPRWARDLADTDDLVQDTLLRTFTKIEDFEVRGAGALQAYLRQAVLNRVRDELRRKGRAPEPMDGDELELVRPQGRLWKRPSDERRSNAIRLRWHGCARATARWSSGASRWTTRTRNSPRCSASRARGGAESQPPCVAASGGGNEAVMRPVVPLDDVADAILDGTPVDWGRLDSAGGARPTRS